MAATTTASSDAAIPPVGKDLQNVHSKPELAHVFDEFAHMDTATLKTTLSQMNGHVQLPKELNLDGFQVVGFNAQADSNKGALFLADKDQHLVALDVDGNEYAKSTAADGHFAMLHPTSLPDQAAPPPESSPTPANGQPHSESFGSHGRNIDVSPDGKTGVYHIKDKDNLWSISADLLGKDNKHLSRQDIQDIQAKIAEISADPRNHIKDPSKIYPGKDLHINMPEPKQPAAPPEAPPTPAPPPEAPPNPAPPSQTQTEAPPALDPSKDNPNLKPTANADGDPVYNPLAPKGLIEGQPTLPLTDSTDGVHERTVTEEQGPDGSKIRHYKGHLADGFLWNGRTKFHADETVDANGGLIKRDINYAGGATYNIEDGKGGSVQVKVQSIHTERQQDGSYKSTIIDTSGKSFDVYNSADGQQLSAVPPSPSTA